jgi:mediator of RNA polymerase II transcription subunit 1
MFEVSSLDLQHLTVTYEMLNDESMSTVEFDLSNITALKCNIYSSSVATPVCPEELASKIIQK